MPMSASDLCHVLGICGPQDDDVVRVAHRHYLVMWQRCHEFTYRTRALYEADSFVPRSENNQSQRRHVP